MSRSLADHAIARGDVSEDRQQRYENGLKAHEKLLSLVSSLADALGETMPELKGLDEETANVTRLTGIGIISDNGSKFRDDSGANLGPWEDEETKFFYENIVDLKDFVPGILLGERQPEGPDTSSAIGDGMESDAPDRTPEGVDLNKDPAILPDLGTGLETEQTDLGDSGKTNVEDELKAADAGPSQPQVDALLGRLANALNRTTIDEIAVEFCYLNTKASRRKLARALLAVPRQRVDLLPYYARLIAILKPYMPDLSSLVSDSLDAEFHRQQRRRDSGFMEEKIKVGWSWGFNVFA